MKDLRQQIEEILPKESAHYYTDQLISLFEKLVTEAKPEDDDCKSSNQEEYAGFLSGVDQYESNLKKLIGGGK